MWAQKVKGSQTLIIPSQNPEFRFSEKIQINDALKILALTNNKDAQIKGAKIEAQK